MSANSAPSDAATAPTRTKGTAQFHDPAATASATGADEAASCCGPRVASVVSATAAYTTTAMSNAMRMARGWCASVPAPSSPSVAMRA